jgi:hypothetical protein
MSTSRRRTLLKVIVLGDSGSVKRIIPFSLSLPLPRRIRSPPDSSLFLGFFFSAGSVLWEARFGCGCNRAPVSDSDLVLCRVGKTSLMNQYPSPHPDCAAFSLLCRSTDVGLCPPL